MDDLIKFQWNGERLEEIYSQERLQQYDDPNRLTVFWNMDELCRRTGMSRLQVKQQFFTDDRFIKFKAGRTWLYPAKETEEFLLSWSEEQKNRGTEKNGHKTERI